MALDTQSFLIKVSGVMIPIFCDYLLFSNVEESLYAAAGFCFQNCYFSSILIIGSGAAGGRGSNFSTDSTANKAECDEASRGKGWPDEASSLSFFLSSRQDEKNKIKWRRGRVQIALQAFRTQTIAGYQIQTKWWKDGGKSQLGSNFIFLHLP